MMMGKSQGSMPPSKGMPPEMDDSQDQDMGEESDDKSSKLLALQNLIGAIGDLAGDDMKPYIDQMQQSMHMQHEEAEGDQMGTDEAKQGMDGGKPGVDVSIGVGKPGMPEEDEGDKPKGFLAILAKKMKK